MGVDQVDTRSVDPACDVDDGERRPARPVVEEGGVDAHLPVGTDHVVRGAQVHQAHFDAVLWNQPGELEDEARPPAVGEIELHMKRL